METAAAVSTAGKAAIDADGNVRPARRIAELEQAQESVLATLTSVSLQHGQDLSTSLGRLCATIATQTQATRAAFWRLGPRGTLSPQADAFGFERDSALHKVRVQPLATGQGVMERIVFEDDLELVKGTSPQLDAVWREAGLRGVKNSIAAPWRAGDRRIGALAVYNSRQGFSAQDLWIVRVAGIAAGWLWLSKQTEDDLSQTAARLEEAMTARRHLLNNIAAGGDEARRRFASALHDDSLQLLTGAELQLERLRSDIGDHQPALDQLRQTLSKVEDSLRRLLINVSPEPLPLPNDLRAAISERLDQLRLRAGIESYVDFRLPDEIPLAIQAIVLKNVAEALNNVEKHARATRVTVIAEAVEGGIRVDVSDDGTGFVVAESVRVPGHIGLVALRERAQLAGGSCRIESDPGAGTRIGFWVPMSL